MGDNVNVIQDLNTDNTKNLRKSNRLITEDKIFEIVNDISSCDVLIVLGDVECCNFVSNTIADTDTLKRAVYDYCNKHFTALGLENTLVEHIKYGKDLVVLSNVYLFKDDSREVASVLELNSLYNIVSSLTGNVLFMEVSKVHDSVVANIFDEKEFHHRYKIHDLAQRGRYKND